MTPLSETEEKILQAAKVVFSKKGYAGARMQEIADQAGINKGLLHYYFRTKDKLFEAIFDEQFAMFAPQINLIFEADEPLFEKIAHFVESYLNILVANPYLPSFVLHEINQKPQEFTQKILGSASKPNPMKVLMQIQLEVQAGRIRPIHPAQLVLNILSMCVFPFVAKPMLQAVFGLSDTDYLAFMETRKKEITDFVIQALRP